MTITNHVNIDLAVLSAPPVLHAMQNDRNARRIEFAIYENSVPWNVADGTKVVIRYRKADGTGGNYDTMPDGSVAYMIQDNRVTIRPAPQVFTASGPVMLAVALELNGAQILTFPIRLQIHGDPGEGVISEDYDNEQEHASRYVDLDLTAYNVDYFAESQSLDVTEAVSAELIQELANGEVGLPVRLTFTSGVRTTVKMVLADRYLTEGGYYRYFGTSGNLTYPSYATLFLKPGYDETAGTWSLTLSCYANQLKAFVKTVNGVGPDEDGNVEVETVEEQFVKLDLSGYYDGVIGRIYADGGTSNLDVTFDDQGRPIKFSNGAEEFEVVWPIEETTEEVTS